MNRPPGPRPPSGRPLLSLLIAVVLALMTIAVDPPASGRAEASPASTDVLADFEGQSTPPEFFTFSGASSVTATPVTVADSDPLARPGQSGDNDVLEVAYDVSDFGGFGQSFEVAGAQDWSNYASFEFWFHGTGSGLTYQAEISDNRSDPAADTSERFDAEFTDTTPGWRYISIPFADFTRATDFQPGGAPDDGFTLTEIWAWAIVLPQGSDTVHIDDVALGLTVIDDFESGLPSGTDADGVDIGFYTFNGAGSTVSISTASAASKPPAPALPGTAGEDNDVLAVDVDATSYAGFIHGFENDAADSWVSQDWSGYEGIQLWLHGTNSGTTLFIDLLENRNPGSTTDDAERWTVDFVDDFSGWQLLEFPFADFTRKEIGNGAPNDGLTLNEVYGWAFGTLNTGGPLIYYLDEVALYGIGEVPPLAVSLAAQNTDITEGTTGEVVVRLNRPMTADDPAEVTVAYRTEERASTATAGRDYIPTSGTLTFVNGGPSELSFAIGTLDDTDFEGDERIVIRLTDPTGAEAGFLTQGSAFVVDDDPFDPFLLEDFERGAHLWNADEELELSTPEIAADDPLAGRGQDAWNHILEVTTPVTVDALVQGNLCNQGNSKGVLPVVLFGSESFDVTAVDMSNIRVGDAGETHVDDKTGEPKRHTEDVNGDGVLDLVIHVRAGETGLECGDDVPVSGTLDGQPFTADGDAATFTHDFAIGRDWTRGEALSFWWYGTGSGDEITTVIKENRTPDPGPDAWELMFAQEFDAPAGTQPDPSVWNAEIGDVTPDGKNGWGNEELQYYTEDPANAGTDGEGNLAITLREADGSQQCYYGPCAYTSARLTTQNLAEFAYGRIEARIKVPSGTGIWPAFWSLGTDIDVVPWPQTGEIDFMEFVGRLPYEIFGTIHGPGYAGGASYGDIYTFDEPVPTEFHTYTVEWEPDLIRWYVDGIQYHEATPEDVAPNEWVFNDPVFLLLNVAVGGNFGGPVGDDLTTPASMLVDYVRVYQGPDTAERWEATVTDSFTGWQQVVVPFEDFTRSATQPEGAPDDGLTLEEVWGYGFTLPSGGTSTGTVRLDDVRVELAPPPTEMTVTSADNAGPGTLRDALDTIAEGGTITLDPSLADATLQLTGPLVPRVGVTIDGSAAEGVTLDGGGSDRVLVIDAGLDVTLTDVTVTDGYGYQLGGGILNNGDLTLERVAVTGNTMTTDAGDFWQGGGGIYNGEGSTLNLIDSTVADNTSGWTGGGIYSFFNTTTNVVRSTVSGNVATDVAGGLRTLGDVTVDNSTLSGNTSTAWHGGAMFITDGVADITNSTVTHNTAPEGTAGGLFVGTFGPSSATLNLQNTIVADNGDANCFIAPFGTGAVALNSLGNNVFTDSSCNPVASDQVVGSADLGPLADNGGPTLTHALSATSPAVDAADAAACPPTDQRGVARDAACDIGAFELVP